MIDTGDANNDELGFDVALSGDAQTMAVGVPYANPNNVNDAGFVRLYIKNGTDWNMSQQINGPAISNNRFGWSLDLSDDGSLLVVGARDWAVYMYELSNITSDYNWLFTTDFVNAAEVCVSGDGSTVGVTSWSIGARIFVRNGNRFKQRGSAFNGFGSHWSGIALNYNGTIAAIGDRYWSSRRGRVGVFQWTNGNGDGSMQWSRMGSDIVGDAIYDYLGYYGCVSITYDGLTVAVGAGYYDRDGLIDRGLVRVYDYATPEDVWNQSGSDLVGDNSSDTFSKTAFSSDGNHLTVGTWVGNYVSVFEKIGSNYEVVGEKVTSEEGGRFGWSVDMSAHGEEVAIGAYYFDDSKGRAYFLEHNELTHIPSLLPTKTPSDIPSTSPSFSPTAAASKTDFALTFLKNHTVIDFKGTSPDKEIVIKTLISNKTPRDSFEQTILVGTDCQFNFVDEYPEDTTLISISNDKNLDVVEGKNIEVTSNVNIDTAVVASKGTHATDPDNKSIYSEYEEDGEEMAKIEFCIRTDYGKVNVTNINGSIIESSVNYYEVKVVVTFLMQVGFASANATIAEAEESKAEQTGTITAVLNACDCPASASSKEDCLDTPIEYEQNDILSICVFDPAENAVITSFKDVLLGNGQISTQVIDSDGKPTTLASVSKLNEVMSILNTRIISAFFDAGDAASPAKVTVSGVALIGFNTARTRKLTAVSMEGGKDTRKLQDENEVIVEGEGAFDVEVLLSDEDQVDGSSCFDALHHLTTLVVLAMIPIVLI